ncbi:MAG: hypothetical protein OXI60_01140 [Acidiferrobacterales bacterium]|nr:hypothetical protein [Acidiferrobacterales bacterium]
MNETEVTWLDQLAVARDLVFDPSHITSYWPEFLYDYDQIVNSQLCRSQGDSEIEVDPERVLGVDPERVLGINLGDIALVWGANSAELTDAELENEKGVYSGYYISDLVESWIGESPPGTVRSENPDLLHPNNNSLNVRELCEILMQNRIEESFWTEDFSLDDALIVTSEVFPDVSIAFIHHVRIIR